MRLLYFLPLLLLLPRSAEPRRDPRSGRGVRGQRSHRPRLWQADAAAAAAAGDGGPVRGRGRAGAVRRQAKECNEYVEGGEKYLDCQDRQLTNVMPGWPADIHHLLLSRNKIQVGPFRGHTWGPLGVPFRGAPGEYSGPPETFLCF